MISRRRGERLDDKNALVFPVQHNFVAIFRSYLACREKEAVDPSLDLIAQWLMHVPVLESAAVGDGGCLHGISHCLR